MQMTRWGGADFFKFAFKIINQIAESLLLTWSRQTVGSSGGTLLNTYEFQEKSIKNDQFYHIYAFVSTYIISVELTVRSFMLLNQIWGIFNILLWNKSNKDHRSRLCVIYTARIPQSQTIQEHGRIQRY